MNKTLAEIIKRIPGWREDAQEEAVLRLLEIEAGGAGVYEMSPEEEAAVNEGLEQVRRREFASDAEVDAVYQRYRR